MVAASVVPDCWHDLNAPWLSGSAAQKPVLFLHKLTAPDGIDHLICVTFEGWEGYGYWQILFDESHHNFAGRGSCQGASGVYLPARLSPGTLTFFAGQPDPADASHFTVGYSVDGQSGIIDGWLKNDRELRLQVRDGPAKR